MVSTTPRLSSPFIMCPAAWCICAAGLCVWWTAARAAEPVTEDELLFMDVPTVVTASRREQKVSEAPSAMFVVTAEDIRRSGATSIPDALRLVPGVNVLTMTARNQSVAVRGFFVEPFSTKVLVMVDGRIVFWDVYGTVIWEMVPVSLLEIDRIEVIVSPASSLYGANAYSGVINIITKTPEQIERPTFRMAGGEYRTLIGTALLGFDGKRLFGKGSFEIDRTDEWRGTDETAADIRRGNALLGYHVNEKVDLSLSLGRTQLDNGGFFADELVGTADVNGTSDYLRFDARIGQLDIRTVATRENVTAGFPTMDTELDWDTWLLDLDVTHRMEIGSRNSLVWGGNYRHNTVAHNEWVPADHAHDLFALFVDDELRLGRRWRLNAGLRYDYHPLTKSKLSPRGGVAFMPHEDHVVRVSASMAYRNPTFIDSYLDLYIAPDENPTQVGIEVQVDGNQDLSPEGVASFELSHHATWLQRIISDVNLFYRRYYNLYQLTDSAYVLPGGDLGFSRSFVDEWDVQGFGGEVNLQYSPKEWLSAFGNYSLQLLATDEGYDGTSLDSTTFLRATPQHAFNLGGTVSVAGLSLTLSGSFRGSTNWSVSGNTTSTTRGDSVSASFVVNGRIGYEYKNAEVSLAVQNLFDNEYYEYPPADDRGLRSSDPLRQKIVGELRCTF